MPCSVLEDGTQFRLEGQVRPDADPPERVGIVTIQRLAVLTVIAGLETDTVGPGRAARARLANDGLVHWVRR